MKIDLLDNENEFLKTVVESEWYKNDMPVLYRGSGKLKQNDSKFTITTISTNNDRLPTDSNIETHQLVNKLSMDKFGVPIRNGLFVTTDRTTAITYSISLLVVVPISNYKLYTSTVYNDMYKSIDWTIDAHTISKPLEESLSKDDMVVDYISSIVEVKNKSDITNNEIMLFGDVAIMTEKFYIDNIKRNL